MQDAYFNKLCISLCEGHQEAYVRRRQPDTLEVEQMKAQANIDTLEKEMKR